MPISVFISEMEQQKMFVLMDFQWDFKHDLK